VPRVRATHMSAHRWSGWPGAWCLDCGQEDQNEICVSEHAARWSSVGCDVHVNGPCPCPGEGLADPYRLNEARRALLRQLAAKLYFERWVRDFGCEDPAFPTWAMIAGIAFAHWAASFK
jgi:hypothetical protein